MSVFYVAWFVRPFLTLPTWVPSSESDKVLLSVCVRQTWWCGLICQTFLVHLERFCRDVVQSANVLMIHQWNICWFITYTIKVLKRLVSGTFRRNLFGLAWTLCGVQQFDLWAHCVCGSFQGVDSGQGYLKDRISQRKTPICSIVAHSRSFFLLLFVVQLTNFIHWSRARAKPTEVLAARAQSD